ncbi:MAG: hypothetical protein Q8J97_14275, partial [Flavobacteriaceae bacterium]|nr:hypothetical protein [Flavobacteriaceae bacterium]
ALVGCLSHLMQRTTRHARPLLPLFVSLPSVDAALLHRAGGLDRHMQAQLRLGDGAFQLLLSATRVVLLLDSLDEVAPHPASGASLLASLAPRLLGANPWCAACHKVVVSCRTEHLDAAVAAGELGAGGGSYAHALHAEAARTVVYHVWPFSGADRQAFMKQAAADRIEELAAREAQAQLALLRETFSLSDDALSHPCVLRIATTAATKAHADALRGIQNRYTLYEHFARSTLPGGGGGDETDRQLDALQAVAVRMQDGGVWQLAVREVLASLTAALDGNAVAAAGLLHAVPSRCEDLHNDAALWGFWHRTVGEYFLARAVHRGRLAAAAVQHLPLAAEFERQSRTSGLAVRLPRLDSADALTQWVDAAVGRHMGTVTALDLSDQDDESIVHCTAVIGSFTALERVIGSENVTKLTDGFLKGLQCAR